MRNLCKWPVTLILSVLVLIAVALPSFAAPGSGTSAFINVVDFGASGSSQTTTGSISVGSSTLRLSAPIDFKNGEGIVVAEAGALPTIYSPIYSTVTQVGTPGSTKYTYSVAAIDINGGVTVPLSLTTNTGNNTLSPTNYNVLTVRSVPRARAYAWWRTMSSGSRPYSSFIGISTTPYIKDIGQLITTPPIGIPSTPPSSAIPDKLDSFVLSGGGTPTLTLVSTAQTAVTGAAIYHNDTPAIRRAIRSITTARSTGVIYFPAGTYMLNQAILLASNLTLQGAGIDQTILRSEDFTEIIYGSGKPVTNVTIEHMTLDANGSSCTTDFNIDSKPSLTNTNITLKFLKGINSTEHGISLWATNGGILQNNICQNNAINGVDCQYSQNVTIENNIVSNSGGNGVDVGGTGATYCHSITVINNKVYNSCISSKVGTGAGIVIAIAVPDSAVTDNYVDTSYHGISLDATQTECNSNTVANCLIAGIYCCADNCTVTDNSVFACNHGIVIASNDNTVSNNNIQGESK